MPVFTCPKCFKDNFFTFSSYAFKKYIENGELNLANVQKDFYKENRTQLQSTIQVEVSTKIIITVMLTLPFKQFWDHLFSTYAF